MQSEITVKNLKKYFAEIKAVDDISFTVQKGELFGFLGVNGAGKSTTIRMMCTLFSPTGGEIGLEDSRLEYMMKRFVRKLVSFGRRMCQTID